jgi:hypothetical protein
MDGGAVDSIAGDSIVMFGALGPQPNSGEHAVGETPAQDNSVLDEGTENSGMNLYRQDRSNQDGQWKIYPNLRPGRSWGWW